MSIMSQIPWKEGLKSTSTPIIRTLNSWHISDINGYPERRLKHSPEPTIASIPVKSAMNPNPRC